MKLPRLTEPMVRENSPSGGERGGGKLVPATWDVALDRAASLIRRSVGAHGPSTFGVFSCSKATNEVNYAAQKLARGAVGSNNIDSCNRT